MSADQIPAKEFMRRLSSIDASLKDIAKSLGTLTKIANRQFPQVRMVSAPEPDPDNIIYTSDPEEDGFEEEDEDDE